MSSSSRRLAALMFTDMVGYSMLARENEELAREMVNEQRDIVRKAVKRHHGLEHQTTGDGFFIEFPSAVNAVQCAVDIQTAMHERELSSTGDRRIKIRIGLHLGDIQTNDGDAFGNGVNVAARVEPLAPAGGICLTRQIFDQVRDVITTVRFTKIGQRNLKNIRGGAEIFKVELPWMTKSSPRVSNFTTKIRAFIRRREFASVSNTALIGFIALSCFGALTTATFMAVRETIRTSAPDNTARFPASRFVPIDLSQGWQYRADTDSKWEPYNIGSSWLYSEKIKGRYALSRTFRIENDIKEPAIVLGLISDTHRLYLNGQFIGGSNRSGELAYYSFSPEILKFNDENTLLIEGDTRPALNPGLTILPNIGASLDNFSTIRNKVHDNDFKFQFLRNLYFGLSLLIFAACFCFGFFRPSNIPYLYSSLVLLLGALNLAYYSPLISSSLEFPFLRFLKVLALGLTPMVLVSAQFRILRRRHFETVNNSLAGGYIIGVAAILFLRETSPIKFIALYNLSLAIAAVYGAFAVLWMTLIFTRDNHKLSRLTRSFQTTHFILAVLSTIIVLSAVKSGPDPISKFVESFTTASFRYHVTEFSLALPFYFSLFLVAVATVDHLQQSHAARSKRRRDRMTLETVRLMNVNFEDKDVLAKLQKSICEYLEIERSTIYSTKQSAGDIELEATSIYSAPELRPSIPKNPSSRTGVLGYVIQNRSPILVPDIRSDRRFTGPGARHAVPTFESYQTGSCMIFPLQAGGRLIGVMTFADKKNGQALNNNDFKAALEMTASLGILLDNQQLRKVV